jgi:pimeloyl-ACP methyl ester carboxylesterase
VPVAAARRVKCVVWTSPFASAREVAQEIYPWLPVSWLLRHPFDSARLAPAIASPALFLAGEADDIIPKHHSDRLAERWGGPVERRSFHGFGHNDLDLNPRYAEAIHAFLDRCL